MVHLLSFSGHCLIAFPCSQSRGSVVKDAFIRVFAASSTSMLETGRQDHAQGTQRPTQSPTQACHWGVASPASRWYHLLRHLPFSPLQLRGADAARLSRRGEHLNMVTG